MSSWGNRKSSSFDWDACVRFLGILLFFDIFSNWMIASEMMISKLFGRSPLCLGQNATFQLKHQFLSESKYSYFYKISFVTFLSYLRRDFSYFCINNWCFLHKILRGGNIMKYLAFYSVNKISNLFANFLFLWGFKMDWKEWDSYLYLHIVPLWELIRDPNRQ